MSKHKFLVYTDGGARGNPGPAGAGAVVYDEEGREFFTVSRFLDNKTNNWAEYEAVYLALEALKKKIGLKALKNAHVEVRTDSELLVKQLNNIYQIKEPSLFPQFIKLHNMRVASIPGLFFIHIPREKNKEADRLANEAMDRGE